MHLLSKPQKRAGNARPYDMDFSADENSTYGTGLPIPYRGAAQSSYRTIGKRQFHGFAGSFDTGLTQSPYSQVRQCATEKPLSCFYKTPLSDLINGA